MILVFIWGIFPVDVEARLLVLRKELINDATQLARCAVQVPLSHGKHNYKIQDCFLEGKIL